MNRQTPTPQPKPLSPCVSRPIGDDRHGHLQPITRGDDLPLGDTLICAALAVILLVGIASCSYAAIAAVKEALQ